MAGVTYTIWDTLRTTVEAIKEPRQEPRQEPRKRSIAGGPFEPLTDVEFDSLYSICPSEVKIIKIPFTLD